MKTYKAIGNPTLLEIIPISFRTLASLRDGLLPKLMRGEVRIKDL